MSEFLITEYVEEHVKNAQQFVSRPSHDEFQDDFVVTFLEDEDDSDISPEDQTSPVDFEIDYDDGDTLEFHESDEQPEFKLDKDETIDSQDSKAMPFRLPGAVNYLFDDSEEEEEKEPEVNTTWEKDRDVAKFMPYILNAYPTGIPSHDGTSTLGCERAVSYLVKLNKEISEALRSDKNDVLDLNALENIRVNLIKDVVTLKEHIKTLNKKHKRAEAPEEEIIKEATTAKIQLVMTPFERAITGTIINAVVSGGKPLEDVYEFLKKKYDFDEREELSIMQLLMDMGQPIFKDRGSIGESTKAGDEGKGHGVDFIKNYFA